MAMSVSKQWTRVRTLGRGASGAEVFLAADDASGELFAVKSATAAWASALRREQGVMSGLCSPRVVSCIGGRAVRDGSYQLFLEFAPGGSLADRVASQGGLGERTVHGYAADVAAGLAYLHGAGMVHEDIKARNVVIGADGRAKLADFGCAREAAAGQPIIGGTPAFMAPEVARGEEQGPAADVWALGCTVVEMATGRAPWSGMDGDALAALHLDEGWIDVLSTTTDVPAKEMSDITVDGAITTREEESIVSDSITLDVEYSRVLNAGEAYDDSVGHSRHLPLEFVLSQQLVSCKLLLIFCNRTTIAMDHVLAQTALCSSVSPVYAIATRSISKFRGRDSD